MHVCTVPDLGVSWSCLCVSNGLKVNYHENVGEYKGRVAQPCHILMIGASRVISRKKMYNCMAARRAPVQHCTVEVHHIVLTFVGFS